MGKMTTEGANAGAGIYLTQFYQIFFEDADENMARMEAELLRIDIEAADGDELNSIFRRAHSVKGGAATLGFADVASLTHEMETLLDKLRRHELRPTAAMIDALLHASDAVRAQLTRHQSPGGKSVDTSGLRLRISAMASAAHPPPAAHTEHRALDAAPCLLVRELEVRVGPLRNPAQADELVELFKEITDLGTIEPLDGGRTVDGVRRFRVITTNSDRDLLALFTFHVARDEVTLLAILPGGGFHTEAPDVPPQVDDDPSYGLFADAPGAP